MKKDFISSTAIETDVKFPLWLVKCVLRYATCAALYFVMRFIFSESLVIGKPLLWVDAKLISYTPFI